MYSNVVFKEIYLKIYFPLHNLSWEAGKIEIYGVIKLLESLNSGKAMSPVEYFCFFFVWFCWFLCAFCSLFNGPQ